MNTTLLPPTAAIFFCLILAFPLHSEDYIKVVAQKGDYVYALLRKYELVDYPCNLEHFYRINQLEKDAYLQEGQEYFLPILLRQFNGQTIRSSIGINDWDTAVRIQKYNERMLQLNFRRSSYKEDRILWVPYHEINCPNSQVNIPSPTALVNRPEDASEAGRFPIFGPGFEEVPLRSNRLQGKIFYLVGGHGGPDPGAMTKYGKYNLCEDEYAYDVTLRLARELIQDGALVYLITRDPDDGIRKGSILPCDTDEFYLGGEQMHPYQKPRLTQRADLINQLYAENRRKGIPSENQKVVIIHVDSRSRSQRVDVFFYHQKSNRASQQTAKNLMQVMRSKYRKYQPNRSYHGKVAYRDLFMIENCRPTTVYIELGNIQNSTDRQRILLESNRKAIASWLREGLLK